MLAKAAGEISSVPPCAAVLEAAHPLPSKNGKDVIICKFLSRNVKYLFHKYKGAVLLSHQEESGTLVKVFDDLTALNLEALYFLYNQDVVDSAWSHSGKIKFTLKTNSGKVCTVQNPLGESVAEMMTPPLPLYKARSFPKRTREADPHPRGAVPAESASRADLSAATAEISAILASQATVSLPVSPAAAVSTPRGETENQQLPSSPTVPGSLAESSLINPLC